MSPRFQPELLAKYPHMAPQDVPVWERFLATEAARFTGIDYDVRVGQGITPSPETDPAIARDAVLLTQKRIDAVTFGPDEIWIIEVKPEASISALGQLLTYTDLFIASRKPDLPVRSVLICETIDRDMAQIFKKHNITVIQV
jgi:hypothetical protein